MDTSHGRRPVLSELAMNENDKYKSNNTQFVICENESTGGDSEMMKLLESKNFFSDDDVLVIYAAAAATMESQMESGESRVKLQLLSAEAVGIRKSINPPGDSDDILQVVYVKTFPNQEICNKEHAYIKLERPLLINGSELGKVGEMIARSLRDNSRVNLPLLPVVSFNGPIAVAQSVVCNNDENITRLISQVRAQSQLVSNNSGIQNSFTPVVVGPIQHCSRPFKPQENAPVPDKPKVKRKYTRRKKAGIPELKPPTLGIEEPSQKQRVSPYTLKVKVDDSQEWKSSFPVEVEIRDGRDANNNIYVQQSQSQSYRGNYRITKGLTDLAKAVADVSCLKSLNDFDVEAGAVRSIELEIEPENLSLNCGNVTTDSIVELNKEELSSSPSNKREHSQSVNRRKSGIKRFTYS